MRSSKGQFLKGKFLPFVEAKDIICRMNISSSTTYRNMAKNNKFPSDIPKSPQQYYSDKGWIDWFNFLGINKTNNEKNNRKYTLDHDYFKTWSHNMAYILGLWWSDGHITSSGRSHLFCITLHNNDEYLLKIILKEMGANNPTLESSGKTCRYLCVSSKSIYDDIVRLGGTERKSLTCSLPNVPKQFLPDFIRGVFDGDGCVSSTYGSVSSYFCSGSKVFVHKLHRVLKDNIPGLRGKVSVIVNRKGTMICDVPSKKDSISYRLRFGLNDTLRLRNFMYSDNKDEIRMVRKYDKMINGGEIRRSGTRKKEYLPFSDVREYVRSLKLKGRRCWERHSGSGKRPSNVPSCPNKYYRSEWTDWYDFLGMPGNSHKAKHSNSRPNIATSPISSPSNISTNQPNLV